MEATDRLNDYQNKGYTIFRGVYDEDMIEKWRDEQDRLEATSIGIHSQRRSWWFGNMLERSPSLMWPAVSHPDIVEFAESVVGPFIQLDNLTLAAFPPNDRDTVKDLVSGWHRDRWSHVPRGIYEPPLSMNAIAYLQDLDDEYGPLRVIEGSHVNPITITPADHQRPHDSELLVYPKAGDVVLTHNGLIHSGTPNVSNSKRYFFSVYYNVSWLKHTDTYDGPNCQQLIHWARSRNDHRALRLLGVDDHLQARANSGFLVPDEIRWRDWKKQDLEALQSDSADP